MSFVCFECKKSASCWIERTVVFESHRLFYCRECYDFVTAEVRKKVLKEKSFKHTDFEMVT